MKSLHISLIAAMALSCTSLSAATLQEALKGGKFSGEFAATTEIRSGVEKGVGGYQDNSYVVGSFAMKYESAVWNNLSVTAKARSYHTLAQGEDGVQGSGEFNGEEPGHNADVFENLFVQFATSNIDVKAGRQFMSSDWLEHVQDAINFNGKWGGTSVELVHSKRVGKITAREYDERAYININADGENVGVYKLGLTQAFTDNVSATAYYLTYPDDHDKAGARVNLKAGAFNAKVHYASSIVDESIGSDLDSSFIEVTASYTAAGWTPYVGFIQGDDEEFYGYYTSEEIVNQMEEGTAFGEANASIIYVGLSKAFGPVNATLLAGQSTWNTIANDDTSEVDETEVTLWLGATLTKELALNVGITSISSDLEGQDGLSQVNATLIYSF